MDDITLAEKQFRQISAVLSGNARDQGHPLLRILSLHVVPNSARCQIPCQKETADAANGERKWAFDRNEPNLTLRGLSQPLVIVLASLLIITFIVMRWAVRRRTVSRRTCWDGGIRRLLPERTYTATGFSNPVRVIFRAIFRPTIVEDTREIAAYGGLVNRMPLYAFVFMVFTLANIGLPGTSGFVGEFLSLIGTFRVNNWVATLATIGTILSAAYSLWLYRKIIFGKLEKPALFSIKDIGWREIAVMAPLVILTIVFGVYPKLVLDISSASVMQLIVNYQHAVGALHSAALTR